MLAVIDFAEEMSTDTSINCNSSRCEHEARFMQRTIQTMSAWRYMKILLFLIESRTIDDLLVIELFCIEILWK
ncbi:MAG: hypothetical protein KBS81_03330 [Spirochaetales bacterium]|nr:hypothetical protein [Candidatus Physcosoma equi]